MPSQADEEAHQLSYLQKHLGNIVSLLADCVEGEVEDSLVSNFLAALTLLHFRFASVGLFCIYFVWIVIFNFENGLVHPVFYFILITTFC